MSGDRTGIGEVRLPGDTMSGPAGTDFSGTETPHEKHAYAWVAALVATTVLAGGGAAYATVGTSQFPAHSTAPRSRAW
jgi:hypothetical protein